MEVPAIQLDQRVLRPKLLDTTIHLAPSSHTVPTMVETDDQLPHVLYQRQQNRTVQHADEGMGEDETAFLETYTGCGRRRRAEKTSSV